MENTEQSSAIGGESSRVTITDIVTMRILLHFGWSRVHLESFTCIIDQHNFSHRLLYSIAGYWDCSTQGSYIGTCNSTQEHLIQVSLGSP